MPHPPKNHLKNHLYTVSAAAIFTLLTYFFSQNLNLALNTVSNSEAVNFLLFDNFDRTVSGSWNNPQSLTYLHYERDSISGVDGSEAYTSHQKAGAYSTHRISNLSLTNTNTNFTISYDKLPTNGSGRISTHFRQNGNSYYSINLLLFPDGTLRVSVDKYLQGTRLEIQNPHTIYTGLNPQVKYTVNMQVAGSYPTYLKMRINDQGKNSGSWMLDLADQDSPITNPGQLGIRTTISSTTTAIPLTYRFDNLSVQDLSQRTSYTPLPAQPTLFPTPNLSTSPTTSPTNSPPLPSATQTACTPPYDSKSPWNKPLRNVTYDQTSKFYKNGTTNSSLLALDKLTLTSDTSQYTYPIYYVNNSMPLRTVRFRGVLSEVQDLNGDNREDQTIRHRAGTGRLQIRIPNGIQNSAGSDGSLIIINTDTGEEYGFWQVTTESASQRWKLFSNNEYEVNNGYAYRLNYSGYPPSVDPIKASNERQFLSRGAGVPYFAGLVRPCEIKAGKISHAIAFAYPRPARDYVFPATKSDGYKVSNHQPFDLPEGSRLQLDPSINLSDPKNLPDCTNTCRIIAKAMQEYGLYLIDISGRPKIIAEDNFTAKWTSLPHEQQITEKTVSPIPLDMLKLVSFPTDLNTQVPRDQVYSLY